MAARKRDWYFVGILNVDGEEIRAEAHWFQEESVGKVKFRVKEWIYD